MEKLRKNSPSRRRGGTSKKLKKPKYENLDQAILSWFHLPRQNNMPISGPLVKAKAEHFAEELCLTSFKASEGWLGKFKQCHHIINYGKISGEARSVHTIVTTALLTDKEILDSMRITAEVPEQEDETDEPQPPPSINEALEAAKLLEHYFLYHKDASISQDVN